MSELKDSEGTGRAADISVAEPPSNSVPDTDRHRRREPGPQVNPLAWAIFRQLEGRSAHSRLFVFRALAARLAGGSSQNPERVDLALKALGLCLEDLGGAERVETVSRRHYDQWRSAQPRPDEYPSSTAIRNTFGSSWAKAMDALGLKPSPEVLSRRLRDVCESYSPEELLEGIRAAVKATNPKRLTWRIYHDWATAELVKPDRELPRIALSASPFAKHFGSWAEAISEAGFPELVRGDGERYGPDPRGPAEAYSDQAVLESLRQAAEELGRRKITSTAYDNWRREQLNEARAQGRPLYLVSSQSVAHRFGGWAKGLLEAGLISEAQFRLSRRRGARRVSDDEALAWLVVALEEWVEEEAKSGSGSAGLAPHRDRELELEQAEYRRWRRARLRSTPAEAETPVSDVLLVERFGSWEAARELAQERRRSARYPGDGTAGKGSAAATGETTAASEESDS